MPTSDLNNLIVNLSPEDAIERLTQHIHTSPDEEEAFILRGKILWSLNRRREAINDYLAAIRLNPQSKARLLLDYANSILDFYNKDLLNP